jgi:alkanesulfonate monooxygenase SsuD/methylene tetrahydromethanopterin reductase-like flavin-dependent oxidoreductase (luciferase family)
LAFAARERRRIAVELGLFVEPQMGGTYRRLVELAQWAEAKGLAAFARSDHYLNMDSSEHATDALASLAGLAIETKDIRLVTLVSPITFRHPAVMAKSATTIDEMSGGRFTLGVGTGWMETEHEAFGLELPELKERFDRLEESLAYIRTVFDGGGTTNGSRYRLDLEAVHPRGSSGLEIAVGGGGPTRTPTLAGRYADEYNLFVTDTESLVSRVDVMRESAVSTGRNPDDILISFAGPGIVYPDEKRHAEAIAERAGRRDMSVDDYVTMLDERNVPHGVPDQAAEAIARIEALGVGRYYVQEYAPLDAVDLERLELTFSALGGA